MAFLFAFFSYNWPEAGRQGARNNSTRHRRTCLLDFRVGIRYPFVVGFLFFLRENIGTMQARNDGAATYLKFLEPFLHFPVDNITFLVHKLGKLHVYVTEHLEDAGTRAKCITWLTIRLRKGNKRR